MARSFAREFLSSNCKKFMSLNIVGKAFTLCMSFLIGVALPFAIVEDFILIQRYETEPKRVRIVVVRTVFEMSPQGEVLKEADVRIDGWGPYKVLGPNKDYPPDYGQYMYDLLTAKDFKYGEVYCMLCPRTAYKKYFTGSSGSYISGVCSRL